MIMKNYFKRKHGLHFSYSINSSEIENKFGKIDPKYEIIELTHTYDKTKNCAVSVFDQIMNQNDDHAKLIDFVRSNERNNNYFTNSRLSAMKQSLSVNLIFFNQYLVKLERQQIFFNILNSAIFNICKKLNIKEEIGLQNDLRIIETATYNLHQIGSESKNEILIQMLCYTLITYGCSFIEKLLREIYIAENRDESNIDLHSLTLGDLLNTNNNSFITKLLGYAQTRCLRFYLHMDENEVGENIRNKFAHLKDVTPKDYTPQIAMQVLWFVLSVINSLTIFYLNKESSTDNDIGKQNEHK